MNDVQTRTPFLSTQTRRIKYRGVRWMSKTGVPSVLSCLSESVEVFTLYGVPLLLPMSVSVTLVLSSKVRRWLVHFEIYVQSPQISLNQIYNCPPCERNTGGDHFVRTPKLGVNVIDSYIKSLFKIPNSYNRIDEIFQ